MDIFTLSGCKNSIRKSGLNLIYAIKKSISLFFSYHLVSRGKDESDECWGVYGGGKGWGNGYANNCIHSGVIRISGDLPTNWYNYALATANTIISKNATSDNSANNMIKATESICPKGWTLPDIAQINSNRDITNFFPVLGGYYAAGGLYSESTQGHWWGTESYSGGAERYTLFYNGSLATNGNYRYRGSYIRCVQAP